MFRRRRRFRLRGTRHLARFFPRKVPLRASNDNPGGKPSFLRFVLFGLCVLVVLSVALRQL